MSTAHQSSREIRFAAVGLDHAHAIGQIEGLLNQGCQLVGFSSEDPAAIAQAVRRRWPDVTWSDDWPSLLVIPRSTSSSQPRFPTSAPPSRSRR